MYVVLTRVVRLRAISMIELDVLVLSSARNASSWVRMLVMDLLLF